MSTPYSEAKPEVWAVHSHDASGISDQHSRVEKQPAAHEEAPLSVPQYGIEISQDERALVSGSAALLWFETVAVAMAVTDDHSIDGST
jgi:hypothetical protein